MPTRAIPEFDPDLVDLDAPWRRFASCRQAFLRDPLEAVKWDTRKTTSPDFKEAAKICDECPVRSMCIPDAVADPTATGNRGGIGFEKGTVLTADADKIYKEFGIVARTRYQVGTSEMAKAG